MQTQFGYHETEIGNDLEAWSGRIHPQDRAAVLGSMQQALQSRSDVWRAEYRFQRKDGSFAHVLNQGFVIRDPGGKPLRMVGAIRDQTERHDYQLRLAEQAALLDQARDAIIVRDLEHRILFWNHGATRLYGWAREEVVGRSIDTLLHRDVSEIRAATEATLSDGEWSGELIQQRRDGSQITVAGN
jgi:PAS domain S-box-containing protein